MDTTIVNDCLVLKIEERDPDNGQFEISIDNFYIKIVCV